MHDTIMTSERRSRGVFRFTARDEEDAFLLGAQQHNIFAGRTQPGTVHCQR
jgi:hypothetical protein